MLTALLQHISPVEISFSAGFFYLTAAEHLTLNSMGRPQAGGVYIAGGFD
jgi:hypothetical protein